MDRSKYDDDSVIDQKLIFSPTDNRVGGTTFRPNFSHLDVMVEISEQSEIGIVTLDWLDCSCFFLALDLLKLEKLDVAAGPTRPGQLAARGRGKLNSNKHVK